MNNQRFLTVKQFCERYCLGRTTFYRLVDQGKITLIKIGRASRISAREAADWAASLPTRTQADRR